MLSERTAKPPEGDLRDRGKQAVVLIHGIGEQRPMDSLRGFASVVWTSDEAVKHEHALPGLWSKPDHLSGSFELRRLTTTKNARGVATDFFEFYWAHLMEGTRLSQVWAWVRLLLLRAPWSIPRRLLGAWAICWVGVLLVGFLALNLAIPEGRRWIEIPGALAAVMTVLAAWLSGVFVVKYLGDAARYLNPAPDNVQARHAIRTAGVELIHALHDSGDYGRIVVVGHSLGSVIGLDVLTHAWPRYNRCVQRDRTQTVTFRDHLAHRMEAPAPPKAAGQDGSDPATFDVQDLQRLYLDELHEQGFPWLVTDFITLGSPLAYPELVMARNAGEFRRKVRDRELPTCPPISDGVGFTYQDGAFAIPHHAAVFGPTRWTNLHMKARALLFGDLISGEVGGTPGEDGDTAGGFGEWIRDRCVKARSRGGLLGHTLYWRGDDDASHLEELRRAVRLDEGPRPWLRAGAALEPAVDVEGHEGWQERSLTIDVDGERASCLLRYCAPGGRPEVKIAWEVRSRSHREMREGSRFRLIHRDTVLFRGVLTSQPRLETVRSQEGVREG